MTYKYKFSGNDSFPRFILCRHGEHRGNLSVSDNMWCRNSNTSDKIGLKLISVLLINRCNFTLLFSNGNLTNQPMISIEKGKLNGVGSLLYQLQRQQQLL